MKTLATFALAIALTATGPATSEASTAGLGYVGTIVSTSAGTVVFNQSGTRTTPPSCQNPSLPTRWAIDITTAAGQAMYSLLLSAYAMNKQVTINGSGTCPASQPDSESIAYFGTIDF